MKLTEVERAYIAGLIDGEGCISGHYVGELAQLAVVVQMGSEELTKWLHSLFGGVHLLHKVETVRTCAMWKWRINGRQCREVLEAVYPYIRLKKEQVALALAFVELLEQTAEPGTRVSEEVKNKRVYLVERIRSLSSVGQRKAREAAAELKAAEG